MFERIAGETLQRLNYALNFPKQNNREFFEEEIKRYDELNQLLKQKAKQQQKPGDAEKRTLQEALITNIRKRASQTFAYADVEKIAV